jgi:GTP-binding protein HflX
MAKKQPEPTRPPREKAFLVGVDLESEKNLLPLEDSLIELELLADTAGMDVVGSDTQKLDKPTGDTYIGKGKVEEVRALVEETMADVIVFDNELSPRHQRELEKAFGEKIKILDRTALILDIFALHAHTSEGMLQVELAQYEYRLPRLTRAWTHLGRQTGGGGGSAGSVGGVGLRGPGETQLEVDKREISRRITHLKEELEKIRDHRQRYRERRKRSRIPVVALVGYTNAGKSTLMNRLAREDTYVADQLFATLDPMTRRITLPDKNAVLVTDTVGFIQKLPTQLIAAFRATLEEITEADLLLHVIDLSHPNAMLQARSVMETLKDIEADHIPVLEVFNKTDLYPDSSEVDAILAQYPDSVAISAKTGEGMDSLITQIGKKLYESYQTVTVLLPYQEGQMISLFHEDGLVEKVQHLQTGVKITGKIPGRLLSRYQKYIKKS